MCGEIKDMQDSKIFYGIFWVITVLIVQNRHIFHVLIPIFFFFEYLVFGLFDFKMTPKFCKGSTALGLLRKKYSTVDFFVIWSLVKCITGRVNG